MKPGERSRQLQRGIEQYLQTSEEVVGRGHYPGIYSRVKIDEVQVAHGFGRTALNVGKIEERQPITRRLPLMTRHVAAYYVEFSKDPEGQSGLLTKLWLPSYNVECSEVQPVIETQGGLLYPHQWHGIKQDMQEYSYSTEEVMPRLELAAAKLGELGIRPIVGR